MVALELRRGPEAVVDHEAGRLEHLELDVPDEAMAMDLIRRRSEEIICGGERTRARN